MKEFRPADDFVSKVMKNVYAYEGRQEVNLKVSEKLYGSRVFRYAMSGGGIFFGIFLAPVACI